MQVTHCLTRTFQAGESRPGTLGNQPLLQDENHTCSQIKGSHLFSQMSLYTRHFQRTDLQTFLIDD